MPITQTAISVKALNSLGSIAGSITPDPRLADTYTATLTGNVAVTAPPVNPSPTAPAVQLGQQMMFILTQDATGGRTITYDPIFKTGGGAALVTTASTTTIDAFIFDGTNWRLLYRITGQ